MIDAALRLLKYAKGYNDSPYIDIAKGKNKIPMTFKEGMKHIRQWRKR